MLRNVRISIMQRFIRTFECATTTEMETLINKTNTITDLVMQAIISKHVVWRFNGDGRILTSTPKGKLEWDRVKAGWAYLFLTPDEISGENELFLYRADAPSIAIYEKNGKIYEIVNIQTKENLELLRASYKSRLNYEGGVPVNFVCIISDEDMCGHIQQFSKEFGVKCLGIMFNFPNNDLFEKPEAVYYEFQ